MHIAQGDSPSPLLYNFAGQILLFKIELNPRIVPACPRKIGPVPYEPFDPFEHKSNKEISTCECFADDNSTFTLLCYHSLSELKNKKITWMPLGYCLDFHAISTKPSK